MTTNLNEGARVRVTLEGTVTQAPQGGDFGFEAEFDSGVGEHGILFNHSWTLRDDFSAERVNDEAGDPEGSYVYVTGDGDNWEHRIEPGTLVEIEDDDFDIDGSYLVHVLEGKDKGSTLYVGASDLDLEAPPVDFKPGDVVRSRVVPAYVFTVGVDGYYDHFNGLWNVGPGPFTDQGFVKLSTVD